MSSQRYISTSFWDDAWVQELDSDAKLLYMYLLTNPLTNIAGVYKISVRRIAFDIGLSQELINGLLEGFKEDKKAALVEEYLILPNWPKHQKVTSKDTQAGIERVLKDLPETILLALKELKYAYPTPTIGPHKAPRRPPEGRHTSARPTLNLDLDLDLDLNSNLNSNLDSNLNAKSRDKSTSELDPLMTNQEPQAVTAVAVRPKKSSDLPEPLKPVYHAVVKAFEEVPESKALLYQDHATTGRELKAVKTMVTRCATLYPDDPGAFSKQIITSFFKLTHDKGKGSISAAFMPSQLMTNWIWYRAIEGLKDHVNEFDQNERIQAILDGRIKTDVVF